MPKGVYPNRKGTGFQKGHPVFKGAEKGWIKKGHKLSQKTKDKISLALMGNQRTLGRKQSLEEILKRVEQQRQEKHWNWKGGITPTMMAIRHCLKYRQWVIAVFKRDDYTCQKCWQRGIRLEAHHIKKFSITIEINNLKSLSQALACQELWDLNNGLTLCKNCHKTYATSTRD